MARKIKRNIVAKAANAGTRIKNGEQEALERANDRTTLPKIPTGALKGTICPPKRRVSIADMDEAIVRGVIEEYRLGLRGGRS